VSKPGWEAPDAGKPQLYDKAPPQWTGVPVERDPFSGKLFSGDPLGRQDKGRSSTRTPGKTAMITAGAVAVVAAVVVAVVLVTNNDPEPQQTAAAPTSTEQTTSAAPTTTTPAVETGPRDIPVTLTFTKVTPPPGFGQDPAYGTVGQTLPRTWTLTGPCDGVGTCQVQHCQAPGQCSVTLTGEPQAGGYVYRFSDPVQWSAPECTGGTIDNTVTWTFTGEGDDVTVTGNWVEQSQQVLFTGTDGRDCGVYLAEFTITSP
jgi:hypothetical protein